jgi:hypothetical protein
LELAVGAVWGTVNALSQAGYARVYIAANGTMLYQLNGSVASQRLGQSVAIGDLDGDAEMELLISSLNCDASSKGCVNAYP